MASMESGGTPRRGYDLRLAGLTDPRQQEAVARWVGARVPGTDPKMVRRALGGAGFVTRIELADEEAVACLREIYATGVPPAAVALVPVFTRPTADPDRALAPFLAGGGRFALTWSWPAFVFGPLWYLRKGLYAKGLVLLALTLVPIWNLAVTLMVSVAVLAYCGLVGNWDDYLWRVKRRQWW